MMSRRTLLALAIFALAPAAQAQNFPTGQVRIIVPYPAGGGTDSTARVLAEKLGGVWGHQVLVENRAGASGMIGTEVAARAAPDGYTLFMGTMGNLTVNKHLFPKMPVDPMTGGADWEEVPGEPDPDNPNEPPGVYDVHSSSVALSMAGTPYNEW